MSYYPDDGEIKDVEKNEFIQQVMEKLFGADAIHGEGDEKRNFSYKEALDELDAMNDVYTEYLIKEQK